MEIEGVRIGFDHPLRERVRLRQEEPVPVAEAERHLGSTEMFASRNNVEHGKRLHMVGMVERHPVGDTRATVVAGDRERVEAEPGHRGDQIRRQRALGVRRVIVGHGRAERVPVPRQIGGDDRKPLR
jgi:hypothetical protein